MATESTPHKRTRVALTVAKNGMTATVVLRAPQGEDEPVTLEEVRKELEEGGVVYGIQDELILQAVENEEYNKPVKVAEGKAPERGKDSQFEYHFDTDFHHRPKETDDGHINYREIDFIQNIEAGNILVSKIPPTPGSPGTTVRGKEIKGQDGRDIPFNCGVNTEISEDGLKLAAGKSGAIQYHLGKVAVMDVIAIRGDVDHTVGNIDCRGSVKVGGDIKAGFKLIVDGDLEVNGKVEDAELRVKGNIMVKGGFFGDGQGIMEADGNINVKFAEGQRLSSGQNILIGGEALGCHIDAANSVRVHGQGGKIIGGRVRARREIRAAFLGSSTNPATELQVAFDPDLIEQHALVCDEIERIKEDEERVKEALYVLYRLQLEGELPPEKKAALEKLEAFKSSAPQNLQQLEEQKAGIEEALDEYREARIICDDTIYPGVRAAFGIVYKDILEEAHSCCLTLEDRQVITTDHSED